MKKIFSVLALMGSATTLLCCFLPVLLVSLGFGAAFAGLIGTFPQITLFSEHKGAVFLIGAILLTAAGIARLRSRSIACPIDPKLAEGCSTAKTWSDKFLLIAIIFYSLGFLFAFVLPALRATTA